MLNFAETHCLCLKTKSYFDIIFHLFQESRNPAVAKLQELQKKESEQSKRRVKTAPARERRRNWNVASVDINTNEGNMRLKAPGDYYGPYCPLCYVFAYSGPKI